MKELMKKLCLVFFKASVLTRSERKKNFYLGMSERCYIKALACANGISYKAAKFMKELKGIEIK